jgi:hypothetical protein
LSARACWASIYTSAAKGVLELVPPQAEVDATLTGFWRGSTMYVTRVLIGRLRAADHFRLVPQQEYVYRKTNGGGPTVSQLSGQIRIPELAGLSCVTEGLNKSQWQAVRPLLAVKELSRRNFLKKRELVNSLVRKYGLPCTWLEAGVTAERMKPGSEIVRQLKRSGRWEQFLECLRANDKETP